MLVANPKETGTMFNNIPFRRLPHENERCGYFFNPQENKEFVPTNATFLEEDCMRKISHKVRSF